MKYRGTPRSGHKKISSSHAVDVDARLCLGTTPSATTRIANSKAPKRSHAHSGGSGCGGNMCLFYRPPQILVGPPLPMRHVDLPVARERAVSALVLAGVGNPHGQVGHGLDGTAALDDG